MGYSIYFSKRKKKITNAPVAEVLKLGRKHKGTHFIFLDADEAFTYPLMKNIRNSIKLREFDEFEKVFLEQYYSGDIELM